MLLAQIFLLPLALARTFRPTAGRHERDGKCGGKGSAFEKPGPDDRFKAGIRRAAQELAMEQGHAPQFQLVSNTIEEHGATDGWKRRAKIDVTVFYNAAIAGKGPGLVSSDCGKCKAKSGADGHSHSAFARPTRS